MDLTKLDINCIEVALDTLAEQLTDCIQYGDDVADNQEKLNRVNHVRGCIEEYHIEAFNNGDMVGSIVIDTNYHVTRNDDGTYKLEYIVGDETTDFYQYDILLTEEASLQVIYDYIQECQKE